MTINFSGLTSGLTNFRIKLFREWDEDEADIYQVAKNCGASVSRWLRSTTQPISRTWSIRHWSMSGVRGRSRSAVRVRPVDDRVKDDEDSGQAVSCNHCLQNWAIEALWYQFLRVVAGGKRPVGHQYQQLFQKRRRRFETSFWCIGLLCKQGLRQSFRAWCDRSRHAINMIIS